MKTIAEAIAQGRKSFVLRAWEAAYANLLAADRETPLELEDLERLAVAAVLTGRDTVSAGIWTRAHHECLRRGDAVRAARCAFWLGFGLLHIGEFARGGGWLGRAQRLLDDIHQDCVEQGYLLVAAARRCLEEGDHTTSYATSVQAMETGNRFHDPDLITLARLAQGYALIRLGATAKGIALLDEIMVAVTADEVSPLVAGITYCAVIAACQEIFDLRRAQEWTEALGQWCASQPDLVSFRSECLVHRAEILQLHGAWQDASAEVQRACEQLSHSSNQPVIGSAFYQQAELHRLRGEFVKAEESYRQASRWGRQPEPGLAQLRLAQGEVDTAMTVIRRAVDEGHDRAIRSKLLAAYVEIILAADDVRAARAAADELASLAADFNVPLLHAVSAQATGAVLLGEGEARAALAALRGAWMAWQELEAPYEAARIRVLIGLACRQLGDEDTAQMEFDAAHWVFQQLGAAPDLARVEALSRKVAAKPVAGLTAREVEVLRLVAAGKTNRAIAASLFISEKTAARHVSNIFTKLGLSSRAAATAYAYEHDLLSPTT